MNINKTTRGKLSETELAYIAGIIDGEGCIGLSRNRTKKQRQKNPKYQSEICVINTNKGLVDWLVRAGGLVNVRPRNDERWKVAYRWRIKESLHPDFLRAILPYLVIKRKQAELIIQYCETKISHIRQGNKRDMSDEELAKRESYYQQMKLLNAKGNPEYLQRLNESTPKGDAIVRTPAIHKIGEPDRNALASQKE
jgi:hypothetical protein